MKKKILAGVIALGLFAGCGSIIPTAATQTQTVYAVKKNQVIGHTFRGGNFKYYFTKMKIRKSPDVKGKKELVLYFKVTNVGKHTHMPDPYWNMTAYQGRYWLNTGSVDIHNGIYKKLRPHKSTHGSVAFTLWNKKPVHFEVSQGIKHRVKRIIYVK